MNQGTVWEMDFNALPLRDQQDKRVWELLVCDTSGAFKQACYCNNQQVKSEWVTEQLQQYLTITADKPVAIRVFRSRMSSILQRGCVGAGIPMRPSRRVYTLRKWMQQRATDVYPYETEFTYQPDDTIMMDAALSAPATLPDKLRGDQWALVTLKVSDLKDMDQWPTEFSDQFPVEWDQFDSEAAVPGLLMTSRRASPLAAWMSGIEPAFLRQVAEPQPYLLLEAGQTDRYIMARLSSEKIQAESKQFEARKQAIQGLHFLAIQSDLQAQSFAGFWLLQDLDQDLDP